MVLPPLSASEVGAYLKTGRIAPSEYDAFKASPAYNERVAQEHTKVFLENHRDKINANIDALQKGIDLVAVCGDMTRTKEQKKQLDLFLKDEQVLQNLPSAVERIPMLLAVKEANEKLKAACEARNEELKKVREATDAVSVYLEGAGGSAAIEERVNQWRQEGRYPPVDVELLTEKEAAEAALKEATEQGAQVSGSELGSG